MIRAISICGVIVAVALAAGVAVRAAGSGATSAGTIQGDADCSGQVDIRDAITVLDYASQPTDSGAGCVPSEGNVNCDGAIDARDSLMLVSYSASLPADAGQACAAIGETVSPDDTSAPSDTPPPIVTSSPAPSETATGTPAPSGVSGIRGIAQEGPMCPVERPESPCPERPVAGAPIQITAGDGSQVTVYTDDDGRFSADEPPGQYEVQPLPVDESNYPMPGQPQQVAVDAGEYTDVTVEYDSGIR
jgi:hypothetical protein